MARRRVPLLAYVARRRWSGHRPTSRTSTESGFCDLDIPSRFSGCMMLSFERPARPPGDPRVVSAGVKPSRRPLKTAQQPMTRSPMSDRVKRVSPAGLSRSADHRQDSKSTWWMPWHLESMKGVDDCDKPRGGVEQPVIRGCPNGETRRR
jgi:hypothetical protein